MSEASDLTNALKDLKDTLTVDAPQRRGSTEPRESFTPAARDESQDKKEDEVKKKSIFNFGKLNTAFNVLSGTVSGLVAVGLRNTVEVYKLGIAFERLGYAIANALKPLIDFLTSFIGQLGAEINFLNKFSIGRGIVGTAEAIIIAQGIGKLFGVSLIVGLGSVIKGMGIPGLVASFALATATAGAILIKEDKSRSNIFEEPKVDTERDYISRLREIDKAEAEGKQLHNGGVGPFAIDESYDDARQRAKEKALKEPGFLDFNLLPPFGRPEAMTPEREKELSEGYKKLKPGEGAEEIGKPKKDEDKKDEDIKPMYKTTFGSLTSLWENMNKLVTEQPGVDAQVSLLQKIYDWMCNYKSPPATQGALAET